MKRKSYITNFSTDALFLVLEENEKEFSALETKVNSKNMNFILERLKQIRLTISVVKNEIITRYLKDNTSLNSITKLFLSSNGIKKDVYQELFVLKCLTSQEFVDLDLLEKAISLLDPSQLMMLIETKKDSIIGEFANNRYSEMIFEVDDEVKKELLLKIKLDRMEWKYGKH